MKGVGGIGEDCKEGLMYSHTCNVAIDDMQVTLGFCGCEYGWERGGLEGSKGRGRNAQFENQVLMAHLLVGCKPYQRCCHR